MLMSRKALGLVGLEPGELEMWELPALGWGLPPPRGGSNAEQSPEECQHLTIS